MKITVKKSPLVDTGKVFRGVILALLLTVFLLFLFSIVIFFSSIPEEFISKLAVIVMALSIAVSSFITSRGIESKGWLNGGLIGLLYSAVIIIVKILFYKEGVTSSTLLDVLFGFLIGAISGAIGVNI
ncbi:TIGR04086 family membrane protein [Thermovenabulum sp.]|uniref:TIGR04086 family membrane protein n=1 Tax=Thermovenabulum sp. TaxID=3100335 RepID=UPI003C7BB71D